MDSRITGGPKLPTPRPVTPAPPPATPATPPTPGTSTSPEETTPAQATGHVEGAAPTDNHGDGHPTTPATPTGPNHQWVAQASTGISDVTHPAADVDAVFGREFDLGNHNHISLTGGYGLRGAGSGHTSHSLLAGAHMENPLGHNSHFVLESGVHGEYNFGHGFHLGGSLGLQYQIPLNSHGTQLNLRAGGTGGTDFHAIHPGGYGGVDLDINDRWTVGAQVDVQQHGTNTVTGVNAGVTFRFGGRGGGH